MNNMVKKSKNALRPDRKLWMYSAHDITIIYVLTALNLFERHRPPYAAAILIELRVNSKNQHVVTVRIIVIVHHKFNIIIYIRVCRSINF